MAQIVQKSAFLEEKHQKARTKVIVTAVASVVCLALFLSSRRMDSTVLSIVIAIAFGVSSFFGQRAWGEMTAARAGLKGQKAVVDMVRMLPDAYVGYQNLTIVHNGKRVCANMVVVGPTGVFIIQSNHRNGRLVGHYGDTKWIQFKTGQKGGSYEKSFDSPVRRVSHQSHVMKDYLESNGVRVWIERMVVFTYPDVQLEVRGEPVRGTLGKVNIYTSLRDGAAESWKYIQSFAPPHPVSAEQVNRVRALFDAL